MELVKSNDPILTTPCQQFSFQNPPIDPIELSQNLVKFIYDNNGLGLACNQVGLPYRMFVMRGYPDNFACFNPKVVYEDNEMVSMDESCLSFPGLVVKIKRPKNIRVRFQTPNSDIRSETFSGMAARVFLHELDHLDGVLYFNRANKYHKEVALKKWKKGEFSSIKINTIGEYSEHLLSR
jgi:peptide deformylase